MGTANQLRQYGDQVQIANEARQRLAAVNPPPPSKRGELTASLLFRFDEHSLSARATEGRVENVATDGRFIFHFVLDEPRVFSKAAALVATEIATGRTHELFRGKFYPLGISLSPDGQQLAFGVGHFESFPKQSIYVVGVDGSNLHSTLGAAHLRPAV